MWILHAWKDIQTHSSREVWVSIFYTGTKCQQHKNVYCNRFTIYTHQGGIESWGIKKPLAKPVMAVITGDKRNAILGNAHITNMSRAIQVWLRAILTTNTCR